MPKATGWDVEVQNRLERAAELRTRIAYALSSSTRQPLETLCEGLPGYSAAIVPRYADLSYLSVMPHRFRDVIRN